MASEAKAIAFRWQRVANDRIVLISRVAIKCYFVGHAAGEETARSESAHGVYRAMSPLFSPVTFPSDRFRTISRPKRNRRRRVSIKVLSRATRIRVAK